MFPTKMKWVCLVAFTMLTAYVHAQTDPNNTRALLVKFESDLSYTQVAHGKLCSNTRLAMTTDFVALKYSQEAKAYEGYAPIRCAQFVMGNCDSSDRKAMSTTDGEIYFKVTPTSDSSVVVYYEFSQEPEQQWSDNSQTNNKQLTSGPLWSTHYGTVQSDIGMGEGYEMYDFSLRKDRAAKIFTKSRSRSFNDRMSKVSDVSTVTLTYIGNDTQNQAQAITPSSAK